MKKVFLLLVVLAVLSASVFAAGSSQQPQPASGGQAAAPAKVQIRASYWGDTKRFDLYDQIIKEFEKVYPNVTVVREPVSWNDYWDKLSVSVAGGNATDFLCMHPQYYADYVPKGVLEPLDPFIANKTFSLDGWAQSTIDTGKWNGKIYMVAMGVTYSSVVVNTGVFKQLGVTPPSFDWSWADCKNIGLQVRKAFDAQGKKDSWMLGTQISNINSSRYFFRQRNHELYDASGNVAVPVQDVQDWFAMWKDFQDNGIVADAATATEFRTATLEQSLFAKDRSLADYIPVNQFWLRNQTFPNKQMAIVRHPGSKGEAYVGEWPEGAHYGIYAKTTPEKKLAAVQLMNFWLNDPRSLVLYKLDQGVPANTPVLDKNVIPLLDPYSKTAVDFVNTLNKISRPTIFPPPGASAIDALFLNKAEMVQFGSKTPAQAAKEFIDEAVAIRAKASR
ncbi:MAG: extracellular solute-binding protein [Treponema sp.]|nr:extracellular solute-binding protein [Treponema sp.]